MQKACSILLLICFSNKSLKVKDFVKYDFPEDYLTSVI